MTRLAILNFSDRCWIIKSDQAAITVSSTS